MRIFGTYRDIGEFRVYLEYRSVGGYDDMYIFVWIGMNMKINVNQIENFSDQNNNVYFL